MDHDTWRCAQNAVGVWYNHIECLFSSSLSVSFLCRIAGQCLYEFIYNCWRDIRRRQKEVRVKLLFSRFFFHSLSSISLTLNIWDRQPWVFLKADSCCAFEPIMASPYVGLCVHSRVSFWLNSIHPSNNMLIYFICDWDFLLPKSCTS